MTRVVSSIVLSVLWLMPSLGGESQQTPAGKLTLMQLEPARRSELDSSSVLKATLEYELPQEPGTYFAVALFDMTTANMQFDGKFPNNKYPRLKQRIGRIVYEFPMKYIIKEKALAEPIRVQFSINVITGTGTSRSVAKTEKYEYRRKK